MFATEYPENTKERKMTTQITLSSTILGNQTHGIWACFYILKIFMRD